MDDESVKNINGVPYATYSDLLKLNEGRKLLTCMIINKALREKKWKLIHIDGVRAVIPYEYKDDPRWQST